MFNDIDFDVAAKKIMDQVTMIRDPELVITIERWMTRLTSDERGPNELNYLKLLQYMMVKRRIGPPFVRQPPAQGPLMPLSKYLNPLPYNGTRDQVESRSWQKIIKYSKAAQTRDFVEEEEEEEEESDSESDDGELNEYPSYISEDDYAMVAATPVATTSSPTVTNIGEIAGAAFDARNVGEDDGGGVDERDGHLAGGGECGEHRATGAAAACGSNKNSVIKLCNPCLDRIGRHLRKQPEPLDAAYADLLGDCSLPAFTEAKAKAISPELLRTLTNMNDNTSLQDLFPGPRVGCPSCQQKTVLVGDKASESLGGGGVGDEDEDTDVEVTAKQSAIKKLLYSLNWLRADCEFHRLFEQQKGLNIYLTEANNQLLANRCRMNGEINRIKDKHTLFRNKSVEQTVTVDQLMEDIQMSIQNKMMPAERSVNC